MSTAGRLYLEGLLACCEHKTGGFLSHWDVQALGFDEKFAEKLVATGLWLDAVEDGTRGYRFADWGPAPSSCEVIRKALGKNIAANECPTAGTVAPFDGAPYGYTNRLLEVWSRGVPLRDPPEPTVRTFRKTPYPEGRAPEAATASLNADCWPEKAPVSASEGAAAGDPARAGSPASQSGPEEGGL